MTERSALLVLDLINDVVHPEGKVGRHHGYAAQVQARGVIDQAARAIARARARGMPVVYVVIGFSSTYLEWPPGSPLFFDARDDGKVELGTWGTEVHAKVAPTPGDPVVIKHRVSPFYQTSLELILRQLKVDSVLLVGVSTEFVVLSAARDAHDRDLRVTVLADATAASTMEHHEAALKLIRKTATVCTVDEALPERVDSAGR